MSLNQQKLSSHPGIPADKDILVCIFQRGAADGLNSLVPFIGTDDPDYLDYLGHRPDIGLQPAEIINLDNSSFALHPALSPLKMIYDNDDLAFVHATGIPHRSRSHFAAQGLVERGVDDKDGPFTGWLGRHLALSPPSASDSAFRVISISGNVPVSLQGAQEPLAISNLSEFGFDQDIIDSGYPSVLSDLFRSPLPFSGPAGAALSAMEELQDADLAAISTLPFPATALGGKLEQAAKLIKSELPVEVICMDSDGWDHHERLPEFLDASLTEMADALKAFYDDMGPEMDRITVLVHTEFGRRVAQNESQGVDHGTAGLAYIMGGGVKGGQVYSDWPGLGPGELDPEFGEDLKITTDLRTVLAEMLDKRLGGTQLGTVFPGYNAVAPLDIFHNKV